MRFLGLDLGSDCFSSGSLHTFNFYNPVNITISEEKFRFKGGNLHINRFCLAISFVGPIHGTTTYVPLLDYHY